MRILDAFLLTGLILALCSCAKHAYLVNAEIPLACIHKPVRMIDCNPNLLNCKRVEIQHDKGCEIITLK